MNIIKYKYNVKEFHINHLSELLSKDDLLVDIETTGFMAARCQIYLIGIGFLSEDYVHIHLYYARTKEEEKEILTAFSDTAGKFKRIVTFNGDGFDLPFLQKRFEVNGVFFELTSLASLDLFKVAKKYKHFLKLEHYKQKDIENFLGIFREDAYSGGELIEIYKRQSLYPSDEDEELLFLHNMEDVKGMVSLLSILDFSILENKEPIITDISIEEEELTFTGKYEEPLNLSLSVLNEYGYFHTKEDKLFGSIKLYSGKFRYYLPNYRDYYYVEDESLLLPKTLKHTINKGRIRRAKKEECFILSDPKALTKDKLSTYIRQMFCNK